MPSRSIENIAVIIANTVHALSGNICTCTSKMQHYWWKT